MSRGPAERKSSNDREAEVLLFEKRRNTDFFNFYRDGRRWDEGFRRLVYEKAEEPHKRHYRLFCEKWPGQRPPYLKSVFGVKKPVYFSGNVRLDKWRKYGQRYGDASDLKSLKGGGGGPRGQETVERNVEQLGNTELNFANMEFHKLLGFGGMGAAALFHINDAEGAVHKVVVKMNLSTDSQNDTIVHEKSFHDALARSEHIVQRLRLQDMLKILTPVATAQDKEERTPEASARVVGSKRAREGSIKDTGEAEQQGAKKRRIDVTAPGAGNAKVRQNPHVPTLELLEELDGKPRFLLLEFMEGGDLHKWMCKSGAQKKVWPSTVLWRILDCLFRGCVAMAYPPRYQVEPGQKPKSWAGEVLEEKLAWPSNNYNLVHFDLDPRNLFLDDLDAGAHSTVPRIKVADLGCMARVDDKITNNAVMMWRTRIRGKLGWLVPEQFTQEWDWVRTAPNPDEHRVAGNYNWWTNLWQVGLVMWCLITQCRPPEPQIPEMIEMRPRENEKSAEVWTYGNYLMDDRFNHIDVDLRALVRDCLIDEPALRPQMSQMAEKIAAKVNSEEVKELDKETLAWIEALVKEPLTGPVKEAVQPPNQPPPIQPPPNQPPT